ncbi:melatonin receptor type 1A [Biomphalaria glabrata]|uniref:Melatonin receptor type 1A-like n=1 Tax=Biomphalaria glabrata TaxID=6526 RepID=A0A2C9LBC8_BIOGL|nr:melatonin receptor type 1A-like [Biomphalaria glabrata]KAI8765406.1 melatonin receptor type 1A-like [Biomphalaria glabrata]KAI8797401.1 melatonin receptor type 1A [Biomphalaria glabrata]
MTNCNTTITRSLNSSLDCVSTLSLLAVTSLEHNENLEESEVVRKTQQPPLVESNFPMALVYVILMISALAIGSVGNILILASSACFRSLRKTGFIFNINLALADLCVSSIADPMCVIAVLKGEAWFNDKPFLCETVAIMCLTSCFCAFLSLTLASLNRYVFVCHNLLYNRIFTKRLCVLMCITAWVIAFFFEFPNLIGWGRHTFDKKSNQCIWDRTASFSYTLIVSVCLIGTPLLTMTMCYVLIFKKIYSTKANLYRMETDNPDLKKKIWSETVKSSRMLFIIFVVFVVLWTPYAVVIAADVNDDMPVALHLFVTMLAHLHSSVNFTVYMVGNRNFRLAVMQLLRCGSCRDVASSSYASETKSSGNLKTTETTSSSIYVTEKCAQ